MNRAFFIFVIGVLTLWTPFLHALPENIYKTLDLFTKSIFIIEKDYVEEVDGEKLIQGAIKGMMGTLDPYSVFLTPDIYKELKVDTVGQFGGVGLEITLKHGYITVVSPIEGTPAERAGIQSGDRILKINGKMTKGMNLADAVRRMRGIKKSHVTLTIYRPGQKKSFDIPIEREVIHIHSVKSELLSGDIAYLRLTNFQEKTGTELKGEIEKLKKESRSGQVTGIILDVRNNPGGLLEEAVTVSDLFLDKGTIVSTKGRVGVSDVRKATEGGDYLKEPMVILVNKGSASASEIVAAALRDNKRAKIIGTKSFGKGSVQTVIDLGEGTGLKLTIAKYYTPSGESISGTGIVPDFEIENPKGKKGEFLKDPKMDLQRKAAISFLKTGKIPTETAKKSDSEEEDKEESEDDDLQVEH